MNCEKVAAHDVAAQISFAMAGAMYVPSPGAVAAVRLHVALPRPAGAGSLFLVRSARSPDWLYRGPFAGDMALRFDQRLAADAGMDTLRFYLFDPAAGQVCAWFNERGEAYWRDGQRIDIDLLDEGEFDADRLFKQHEVRISR